MPPLYNPEVDALLDLIQRTGQMPNSQVQATSSNVTGGNREERPIEESYSESFPSGGSFSVLPAGQAGLFGGPEGILSIKQPDPSLVARGQAIQQREASEAGLQRLQRFVKTPQGQLLFKHLEKLDPGIQATVVGRLMGQPEGAITTKSQRELETFQAKERFKSGLRREEAETKKAEKTIAEDRGFHWLDPNTGEPLPPDTLVSEANKIKAKRVTPPQFQTAQSALNGLQVLNQFESLAKRLPIAKEPSILGKLGGGLSIKLLRSQGDPLASELDALSTSITQLAVAFGGDRRITEQERALLFQAVPQDFDNLPSALKKIETTRKNLLSIAKRLDIPVPQELRGGMITPEEVSKQQSVGKPTSKGDMPPAAKHRNRVLRDTQTGQRFMSNGTAWVPLR